MFKILFRLFLTAIINIAPSVSIATEKIERAMVSTGSKVSEIEAAANAYTRDFMIQIVVGVIVTIVLAYLALRVWNSGNRLQDALMADAQARIEAARADAAKANENIANAKVEIANLTAETITAKKETMEVSLKLEEQARKRADAERALLELIERVQPRRLNTKQEAQMIQALRDSPVKGLVRISHVSGDAEGSSFARQLNDVLQKAGWPTRALIQIVYASNPVGIAMAVPLSVPNHAEVLRDIFGTVGIELNVRINKKQPADTVLIRIGNKPPP